ncbi:class E sortase [Marmoricola sp. Leaf446]|uniref:class E sortase n=1 Tax=Marmoricola sp. Leaf446 TaxID=1736379 RepID=UPI000A9C0BDE|nr:class E sortase [Marmoricola sp. Leaf446]
MGRTRALLGTGIGSVLLAACTTDPPPGAVEAPEPGEPTRTVTTDDTGEVTGSAPPPWVTRSGPSAPPTPAAPAAEPRTSYVSIPALGLREVPVQRYRGRPDDAPGTAIQDTGVMASPRGPGGGVGPGEVGNFLVTGHRTSHGAPLAQLPALADGARVEVRSGDRVLVYRVTATRETSFRSPASLRAQAAPVPGRPGVRPTEAMLTLSTCATPEDHAAGNYWSDEFGNPEHRIDKIAVLVRERPA